MNTPKNRAIMTLANGKVVIELKPDLAPNHVKRIKQLMSENFYDHCPFHRVIDGFMAQTGDSVNQDGTGGSSYPDLKQEFSKHPHKRGVVSMARAQHPDSANSQFFICYTDCPHLDGQYTVFGEVIEGMDLIDAIKKGAPHSGIVTDPDHIISFTLDESSE